MSWGTKKIEAPQSFLDWCAKNHEVNKRQKTTDPSPVTDTSSGTDLADMSDVDDVMKIEDEKEQALHGDEYNENLPGGVGDGAGVPKNKAGEIVKDDDADVEKRECGNLCHQFSEISGIHRGHEVEAFLDQN